MTTPASAAPGGGAGPDSPTGSQTVRPPDEPADVLRQAQARSAEAEQPERDKPGLSPDEERQLGELMAKRDTAAGPAPTRLKVEGVHESVTFGGITVGREFTDVPATMVAAVTEAAASAGVKITQDQES